MSKKKSFEEAVKRLDEIVTNLENNEIKLDDMLQLYEEGAQLIKFCLKKLDDVENKINILSGDDQETLKEEPFDE
jgi:exodeoxyribonuclease VII small subunit